MEEALIARDLTIALLAALLGGLIATRLNQPAIIGYLLAGILIGPYTPGVTGDVARIQLLAEIGVVLLMFGVGVEFSLEQLRDTRGIAIAGGGAQVLLTILLGIAIGSLLDWPWGWRIFFGCILAISSTTVLLKLLMDRGELGSQYGQITISIALVQDLSTVLMIALLPALTTSGSDSAAQQIGWAILRATAFLALMLLLGKRIFPLLLTYVARYGSRELFLLAAVALSIGTAFMATAVFGLSLALGSFIAGLVVSESELHYRILGETLPLRDIFATLFFVSVGMLIDPQFIWTNLGVVLIVAAAIVLGKFVIATVVTWPFPYPRQTILLAAAALAQIGEFSFILAQQGLHLGVLDNYIYGLTLSGALISTILSPLLLRCAGLLATWLHRWRPQVSSLAATSQIAGGLQNHVVICGYGRVAWHLVEALQELGHSYVVIEQDWARAQQARDHGAAVIYGDATMEAVLGGAALDSARTVAVTIPDSASQRLVIQQVHALYPHVPIIARARRVDDLPHLYGDGASDVIVPSFEGGLEMLRQILLRLEVAAEAIQSYTDVVHQKRYAPWQRREHDTQLLESLKSASSADLS